MRCRVENCERKSRRYGMCDMHSRRFVTHGDPHYVMPQHLRPNSSERRYADHKARFQSQIRRNGVTGCLEWIGSFYKDGYGMFGMQKKSHRAHRAAWMLFVGDIPDGLLVLHKCDNPKCVNTEHLFLGTTIDNIKDKMRKGRQRNALGSATGSARLTEEQALRVARGIETQAALAREFGVSINCIHAIRAGKTWSHLTGIRRAA